VNKVREMNNEEKIGSQIINILELEAGIMKKTPEIKQKKKQKNRRRFFAFLLIITQLKEKRKIFFQDIVV